MFMAFALLTCHGIFHSVGPAYQNKASAHFFLQRQFLSFPFLSFPFLSRKRAEIPIGNKKGAIKFLFV